MLEVYEVGQYYNLRRKGDKVDVGTLDLLSTSILRQLRPWPKISQTAVLPISALQQLTKKDAKKAVKIDASINIFGPERLIDRAGEAIAKANGYLQHPCFLEAGLKYINPHYFYSEGYRSDIRHLIGPPTVETETLKVAQGLEEVLVSLGYTDQAIEKYGASLEIACTERMIITTLKRYDTSA